MLTILRGLVLFASLWLMGCTTVENDTKPTVSSATAAPSAATSGESTSAAATPASTERYVLVRQDDKPPVKIPWTERLTALRAYEAAFPWYGFGPRELVVKRSDGQVVTVRVNTAESDPQQDPQVYPGDVIVYERKRW